MVLRQEAGSVASQKYAPTQRFKGFQAGLSTGGAGRSSSPHFKSVESSDEFLSSLTPSQRDEFADIVIAGRNLQSAMTNLKANAEQLVQEKQNVKLETPSATTKNEDSRSPSPTTTTTGRAAELSGVTDHELPPQFIGRL